MYLLIIVWNDTSVTAREGTLSELVNYLKSEKYALDQYEGHYSFMVRADGGRLYTLCRDMLPQGYSW